MAFVHNGLWEQARSFARCEAFSGRLSVGDGFSAPIPRGVHDDIWPKFWGHLRIDPTGVLRRGMRDAVFAAAQPSGRSLQCCWAVSVTASAPGESARRVRNEQVYA